MIDEFRNRTIAIVLVEIRVVLAHVFLLGKHVFLVEINVKENLFLAAFVEVKLILIEVLEHFNVCMFVCFRFQTNKDQSKSR